MTTQIWVDETRDMLLSGYVEDLDILTGIVAETTETVTIWNNGTGVVPQSLGLRSLSS